MTDVQVIPTLIDQFRETFEGEVRPGWCWVTDGPPATAMLGTIAALSAAQAFAPPVPGARSAAAHVAHVRFALDLTLRRMRGEDPPADWKASFDLPPASPAAWEDLKRDLRRAYDGVLAFLQQARDVPVEKLPPINVVGLAAQIAHNAYHLGAIRQIVKVTGGGTGG